MKIEKELKLYKKALLDYRLSKVFGKFHFYTKRGFCYYFTHKHNMILIEELDVLYSLKPIKYYAYWWFKPGELNSRIKLLKKAILICKHELNNIN